MKRSLPSPYLTFVGMFVIVFVLKKEVIKLSEFFKIFIRIVIIVIIVCSISQAMLMIAFWNKEIENKTICIPALLKGMEVTVLGSGKSLPSQELSGREKGTKVFVTYGKDVLILNLFNSETSECISEWKQSIKPIDDSGLFADPRSAYIKDVTLKGDLLEVEFDINRTADRIITICFIIASMILFGVCINKF